MRLIFIIFCVLPSITFAKGAVGLSAETSRFSWDNDFYYLRDQQISNVFSYQRHLEAKPYAQDEALWSRQTWAVQQTMQTPNKDTPANQLQKDVPFVGTLTFQKSCYVFADKQLKAYALSIGVAGSLSLADKTQALVHRARGVQIYSGWSKQYPDELLMNAHLMRKWKIASAPHWDVSIGGNAALGNIITQVGSDIELRFGLNLPIGFAYTPNTFGFHPHYLANVSSSSTPILYASMTVQGYAVAHNMYLDGSLFQTTSKVKKLPFVGIATLGIHYETTSYGIHFTFMASSPNVDTKLSSAAIGNERIGALTYDWRY